MSQFDPSPDLSARSHGAGRPTHRVDDPVLRERLLKDPIVAGVWQEFCARPAVQGSNPAAPTAVDVETFWHECLPAALGVLEASKVDVLAAERAAARSGRAHLADEERRIAAQIDEWWGQGLGLLEELIAYAQGVLISLAERLRDGPTPAPTTTALLALFGRGVLASREVVGLLRGGYASGAEAHWRTLNEMLVYATLIARHRDVLAERFIKHEAVFENYAARALAEAPHASADTKGRYEASKARLSELVKVYGPAFRGIYGWAEPAVASAGGNPDDRRPRSSPKFEELQRAAGYPGLQVHHAYASDAVHGGVRGMLIHPGRSPEHAFSGPTPYGIDSPGLLTAGSLVLLIGRAISVEEAAGPCCRMQYEVIQTIGKEVVGAFVEAGRRRRSRNDASRS